MLMEEIRKQMLLITAMDAKLKKGYSVSDVDVRLARDDIKQVLAKIDRTEQEFRKMSLAQA
jgi:hypothetical protein